MTLEEEQRRGHEADRLLENTIFRESFDTIA